MLTLQNVSVGYDDYVVIKNLSTTFEHGKFYGILGPNGSGKTTLLKAISGVLKIKSGHITLLNKPIESYSAKELAKLMSVLPQLNASSFSNTVRETVAIGRYPHQRGFFSSWSKDDEEAVQMAMQQTGITQYEHTPLPLLSGGEQQRTFIAQALAQRSNLLLLDEPTNHLDITHQKQSLDIVRQKVLRDGLTVIAIFHDINLASIYCDSIILMNKGEIIKQGTPLEVVREKEIQTVYNVQVSVSAHPLVPKPQITMIPFDEKIFTEIEKSQIEIKDDGVYFRAKQPLKTISSAVYNAGIGWYETFINRTVGHDYQFNHVEREVMQYLHQKMLEPVTSVVMLTAVDAKKAIIETYNHNGLSIIVVVTAGVGHAIDASKAYLRSENPQVGTINLWVLVNGKLTDEAFVQAMITATEAKVKALQDEAVMDLVSQTVASGTGTDSLLIAANQKGQDIAYAGPLTTLGQLIGRGVYDATRKAIQQY